MNGPPSSGQQVIAGSRSRLTSDVTFSVDRPACTLRVPTFSSSSPTSRAPHSFAGVGGNSVSASSHEAADQPQRPLAECQLGAPRGAEQIGDEARRSDCPRDVGEEQRRSAGCDDATMNFGDFEMADRQAPPP